ncbi:MAG TPA: hypothetical protein VM711_05395 [Sphingomicrobium sp.]|nr:hypothetical protein [Sphingomicrobium sp.]
MPVDPVRRDIAELPPLPPAPTAPIVSSAASARASVELAAPRLRFGCDTPGDPATDAPCALFERETVVTIHAAGDVPGGTRLEFVRNNEPRAGVALDGLRRGGSLRVALPAKVCSGFTNGKLELRVVRSEGEGASRQLSSEGPYNLSC